MEVLGVGIFRTGTTSLQFALTHWFAPVYGGSALWAHPSHVQKWLAFYRNPEADLTFFDKYRASSGDSPCCILWEELHKRYPEAKVILTVRDPDDWVQSYYNHLNTRWTPKHIKPILPIVEELIDNNFLKSCNGKVGDEWRRAMKKVFIEHNEKVQDTIDSKQLLVFDVRDGYDPLMGFLGVSPPRGNKQFPKLNPSEPLKALSAAIMRGPHDSYTRLA